MRRALAAAFLTGLAALAVGLALIFGAVAAAGDWWLARQPWIGLGLDALVIGLAVIHIAAPPLILVGLAPNPWRGVTAYVLLVGFATFGFGLSSATRIPPESSAVLFAALFLGWVVAAVALLAWRERLRRLLVATAIVPVVGLSAAVTALWWLIVATGGYARTDPPGGQSARPSLADAGTLIYSAPDIALTWLGLPTIALVTLSLLVLVAGRRAAPRRPVRPAMADGVVLT